MRKERVGTHLVTEMKMKRRLCVIFRLGWYSPTSSYSLPPFIFVSRFSIGRRCVHQPHFCFRFLVLSNFWPFLFEAKKTSFVVDWWLESNEDLVEEKTPIAQVPLALSCFRFELVVPQPTGSWNKDESKRSWDTGGNSRTFSPFHLILE